MGQTLIERKNIKRCKKSETENRNLDIDEIDDEELEDGRNQDFQPNFKRQHSFFYKLRVDGEFIPVCKNIFIATHGVTVDRVRRLLFY